MLHSVQFNLGIVPHERGGLLSKLKGMIIELGQRETVALYATLRMITFASDYVNLCHFVFRTRSPVLGSIERVLSS